MVAEVIVLRVGHDGQSLAADWLSGRVGISVFGFEWFLPSFGFANLLLPVLTDGWHTVLKASSLFY